MEDELKPLDSVIDGEERLGTGEGAGNPASADSKSGGKQRLKRLGVAVVVVAIFFAFVAYAGYVLTPKDNGENDGVIKATSDAIYAEPENSLDVVFLGNSAAAEAIDPMLMWKKAGVTSYVYAPNGQRSVGALSALKKILQVQSPSVVVVEADVFFSGQQPEYALYQVMDDLFPVAQYHHRWKDVTLRDFYAPVNYTHLSSTKGHIIRETITDTDISHYMEPTDEAYYCGNVSEWALSAMIDVCEQAGAQLMVVSVPSPAEWNMQRYNGMQQLSEKYGFAFLDLNQANSQMGMDWSTDSRDYGKHLNWKGAAKATHYLLEYLKSAYDLPDHRGDSAYAQSWDDQVAAYDALLEAAKSGERVM